MQRRRRAVTAVDYDFYKRRFPELQEQFPVVFNKLYPLPLFVGVHKALEENTNFTPKEISALLNIWVQRHEYSCMACSIGRRYDLDGKDAGEIDPLEMTGFIKAVVRLHPNAIRK
ncbi:UNVERIFIED_CONTAM: ProQ/FINO family protein, partial [Kocuria sp. CPCC 205274]